MFVRLLFGFDRYTHNDKWIEFMLMFRIDRNDSHNLYLVEKQIFNVIYHSFLFSGSKALSK